MYRFLLYSFFPEENFIFDKAGPKHMRDSVSNFYYTNGKEYKEKGYEKIQDVPEDLFDTSKKSHEIRLLQKKAHENDREIVRDDYLNPFIENLTFPIHFLDFEAYNPKRKNVSHLPFQHSLHLLEENGRIRHFEFMGKSKDPRKKLRQDLLQILEEKGSIVVFNKKFERKILNQLDLEKYVPRLEDLWLPFKNFWYYHPEQAGKTGLKTVYPIVTGNNGYKDLNVSNGMHAQKRYEKMLRGGFTRKKKEELLKYCALDTYSMYEIIEEIKKKI